ncbi:MAG: hypothetical protein M0Z99_00815 [Betaproteobacteria bacterium]|nr:hypothetical protein [Betaproteobacteria bacterium]
MHEEKFRRESIEGVEAVLERMWEAVGKPLCGYALAFDVSENDIKNWRRRGRVARGYLEGFASEHGVSLDWLLHGDAAPRLAPASGTGEQLNEDEAKLLETYRRISPEARVALRNLLKVIATEGQAEVQQKKPKPRQPRHAGAVEPVSRRSAPPAKKPGRARGPGGDA